MVGSSLCRRVRDAKTAAARSASSEVRRAGPTPGRAWAIQ